MLSSSNSSWLPWASYKAALEQRTGESAAAYVIGGHDGNDVGADAAASAVADVRETEVRLQQRAEDGGQFRLAATNT